MSRPITSNTKKNRKRRSEYGKEVELDKLADYEEFKDTVLPQLQKLLMGGATVEEMRNELAPFLEARKLSIALTSPDEGKALQAIADAQNRIEGKATEKIETTHRFSSMRDEELDALLTSRLKETNLDESDDDTIQ